MSVTIQNDKETAFILYLTENFIEEMANYLFNADFGGFMSERFLINFASCALAAFLILFGTASAASGQQKKENKTQKAFVEFTPLLVNLVREAAQPLSGDSRDYDPLLELIGDSRFVMLGESTHGTHEFYRERARITRRLIEEKGFNAVVLEADWTDAARVNDYIQGRGSDKTAQKALSGFTRFPRWMWQNTDFADFVNALRNINGSRPTQSETRVGVYGMDLYGLAESIDVVINHLKSVDPEAARRARKRYGCFARFREEPQRYGLEVSNKTTRSCEKEAEQQLQELQQMTANDNSDDDESDKKDDLFDAYQNAKVVKSAEAYYRTIYNKRVSSWNLRDKHMFETLVALLKHLDSTTKEKSKIVVWAHNTHQGDAQATYMAEQGEWNVGQLIRQQYRKDAVLVGFTTYAGYVRAASEWDGFDERKRVRPALEGSYSALFHKTGVPNFLLLLRDRGKLSEELSRSALERAIGVIYLPQTERQSHYFYAQIAKQFDAVIHYDVTSAVKRLY
ncbi:MAG TPA: erythromycin esterase family protein [Pyrinomonadaceae bacterium]